MLLKVNNIKVHYEQAVALNGVSLEVAQGEVVSLIGSNGAGKTTTLKTIVGLKRPTRGDIWFEEQRIDAMLPQAIVSQGIALIPQDRRVFPYMTVLENLMMGAYLRKDRKAIGRTISEMNDRFPALKERGTLMAGSLSGGEQQMLSIARALMSNPRLLLMDEPSLGLSPLMVLEVAKVIQDINRSGVTILLVEQNARLALKLANRGYVLQNGSIVLQGDTADLIGNELVKRVYLGG